MWIFMGVPWEGALNNSRVIRTGDFFLVILVAIFSEVGAFRLEANIIEMFCRLSSNRKMLGLE